MRRKLKKFAVLFDSLFKVLFLRQKEAVFWLSIFPTILFLILSTLFGNVEENIELKVKIIGHSKTLENVFKDIKQLNVIFEDKSSNSDNPEQINKALKELENEKLDLVVVLPDNFDSKYSSELLLRKTRLFKPVPIDIHYISLRDGSKIAKDIVEGIFTSMGLLESTTIEKHYLSQNTYDYNNFIYPGVVGMAILSVFLFGFMSDIQYFKTRNILRKFFTAPINPVYIYILTAVVNLLVLFLGVGVLSVFSYLKGVDVISYLPNLILNLLFSSAVMITFVIALMTFVTKPSNLFAFQQVFFQVQMFVGGFYVPLKFTSPIIQTIAKFLPITYIVDNMRTVKSLNSIDSNHFLVPLIYILVASIITIIRSKKLSIE